MDNNVKMLVAATVFRLPGTAGTIMSIHKIALEQLHDTTVAGT